MIEELLVSALGTGRTAELDAITAAAADLTGCALAALTLVRGDMLWFKSSSQGPMAAIPRADSFCAHLLAGGQPLVIPDTLADARFQHNDLVTGEAGIRFYAGVPLTIAGCAVGTLCVLDRSPQPTGADMFPRLSGLAAVVEALIEARLAVVEEQHAAARLTRTLAARDQLHRQFQQAERMADIGSWRLCLADQSLEYSDQVYVIHDLPVGHAGGLDDALRFYPPPDRAVLSMAIERAIATGQPYDLELDFVTAKGRLRRVRALGEPEIRDGSIVALIGVFQDITERHRLQTVLERRANTDELTALAGRRPFNAHLDDVAARIGRDLPSMALVLIDLDHFKQANDRYGHAAGDEVLCHVGRALHADWLAGSFAARLGGDEFALVITDQALMHALSDVVERLRRALVVEVAGGEMHVTATLGICAHGNRPTCRKNLLEAADSALYRGKRQDRGTACFAASERVHLVG